MEEQLTLAEQRLRKVEEAGARSVFLYSVTNFEGWRYDVSLYYLAEDNTFVAIVDEWPHRTSGSVGYHRAKEAPTLAEVFQWANEKTMELNSFSVDIERLGDESLWHTPGDAWTEENK